MSSAYILEPPTKGKVVLKTLHGDVEIELWPKEAPNACRNFVQLCLEGYYNETLFHRIVPGFIIQGGDPTGTGSGGESVYGNEFEDEFHSRLRFNRRGMVGMANNGPHSNGSQFFITLGKADELTRKNTLFGKVVGDSLFNVLKMGEVAVEGDRPIYAPMVLSATVFENPFDDIVPRVVRVATEERQPKKKGLKNKKLLSFDDEQLGNSQVIKSSHEIISSDPRLLKETAEYVAILPEKQIVRDVIDKSQINVSDWKRVEEDTKLQTLKEKLEKTKQEMLAMEKRKTAVEETKPKAKKSLVQLQREKYLLNKSRGEEDTLRALAHFEKKLKYAMTTNSCVSESKNDQIICDLHAIPGCESCFDTFGIAQEESEEGWMGHSLKFGKDLKGKDLLNARRDDPNDYVVIDPLERKRRAEEEAKKSIKKRMF